jgi:hypothetical protein
VLLLSRSCVQVRQALANGNVLRFFRLYSSAPLLSRRLMDAAVKQLRYKALCALVRSHKPTAIALPFLARSLGFTSQEEPAAAAVSAAGLEVALGALTVDSSGSLLRGCSEQRCVGDYAPCADEAQALVACLEWCQQHGAVFDQTKGEGNWTGRVVSIVLACRWDKWVRMVLLAAGTCMRLQYADVMCLKGVIASCQLVVNCLSSIAFVVGQLLLETGV